MNMMELDAMRNELARRILATDNIDVLNHVREVMELSVYPEPEAYDSMGVCEESVHPYTMEELNRRIDAAEAEEGGTGSNMFFSQLEKDMPWLCK